MLPKKGVITVGSVDKDGKLSAWSNYGDEVDLYAPWDVLTLEGTEGEAGTSFSAAFVAGIAALMISDDPDMTREDVLASLKALTADIVKEVNVKPIKGINMEELLSRKEMETKNQAEFTGYSPKEKTQQLFN